VTITGVLTAVIGMQIARVNTAGGWRLTATFDDASGLMKGDEVKIAGAPVGQVDEVEVVDGKARVSLTVRESARVPADSEAAIRWRDAMGRRVVYLLPGKSAARMRPGAHIEKTRSAVDGSALLDQLGPLVRSLDPKQVNTVLVS
ncbi:MCE family protein, partial [Micromonospora aurantiaca]|nr:MCE family protein [Micromonospora aurantiaca]